MKKRISIYLASLGLILSTALTLGGLNGSASAVVDNTPDCDNVAIIRCGVFDSSQLRQKATPTEIRRVFDHMGIGLDELDGQFVNGVVWRDGRVTVDGKTVATGAMTAARNMNGSPIPGTTNIGTMSVSRFATEGQTAFVKMKSNGTFDFAVIKSCGNPVIATPTKPATPVKAQNIQVCDLRTNKVVTIRQSEFISGRHSKDLSRCENRKITVCEIFTGKIITIDESKFIAGHHSRNLNNPACAPATPTTPTTVRNIHVCDLNTKQIVTINENQFDSTMHSRDLTVCQAVSTPAVTTPVTPPTIVATGPETVIGGIAGTGALGYGAYAYAHSRRTLLNKLLKR